jgi:site-specific DNA recombinase
MWRWHSRLQTLLGKPEADWQAFQALVLRIEVRDEGVTVDLDRAGMLGRGDHHTSLSRLQSRLDGADKLSCAPCDQILIFFIATRPVFRGGRTWLVRPEGVSALRRPDQQLIKALAQAHRALTDHDAAPAQSLDNWRGARAIADSYMRRLTSMAFLAPDVQRAILEGRQPAGLTAQQLSKQGLPLAWADQRRMFGLQR